MSGVFKCDDGKLGEAGDLKRGWIWGWGRVEETRDGGENKRRQPQKMAE